MRFCVSWYKLAVTVAFIAALVGVLSLSGSEPLQGGILGPWTNHYHGQRFDEACPDGIIGCTEDNGGCYCSCVFPDTVIRNGADRLECGEYHPRWDSNNNHSLQVCTYAGIGTSARTNPDAELSYMKTWGHEDIEDPTKWNTYCGSEHCQGCTEEMFNEETLTKDPERCSRYDECGDDAVCWEGTCVDVVDPMTCSSHCDIGGNLYRCLYSKCVDIPAECTLDPDNCPDGYYAKSNWRMPSGCECKRGGCDEICRYCKDHPEVDMPLADLTHENFETSRFVTRYVCNYGLRAYSPPNQWNAHWQSNCIGNRCQRWQFEPYHWNTGIEDLAANVRDVQLICFSQIWHSQCAVGPDGPYTFVKDGGPCTGDHECYQGNMHPDFDDRPFPSKCVPDQFSNVPDGFEGVCRPVEKYCGDGIVESRQQKIDSGQRHDGVDETCDLGKKEDGADVTYNLPLNIAQLDEEELESATDDIIDALRNSGCMERCLPTHCADGVDNVDSEDTDIDELDSACDFDGHYLPGRHREEVKAEPAPLSSAASSVVSVVSSDAPPSSAAPSSVADSSEESSEAASSVESEAHSSPASSADSSSTFASCPDGQSCVSHCISEGGIPGAACSIDQVCCTFPPEISSDASSEAHSDSSELSSVVSSEDSSSTSIGCAGNPPPCANPKARPYCCGDGSWECWNPDTSGTLPTGQSPTGFYDFSTASSSQDKSTQTSQEPIARGTRLASLWEQWVRGESIQFDAMKGQVASSEASCGTGEIYCKAINDMITYDLHYLHYDPYGPTPYYACAWGNVKIRVPVSGDPYREAGSVCREFTPHYHGGSGDGGKLSEHIIDLLDSEGYSFTSVVHYDTEPSWASHPIFGRKDVGPDGVIAFVDKGGRGDLFECEIPEQCRSSASSSAYSYPTCGHIKCDTITDLENHDSTKLTYSGRYKTCGAGGWEIQTDGTKSWAGACVTPAPDRYYSDNDDAEFIQLLKDIGFGEDDAGNPREVTVDIIEADRRISWAQAPIAAENGKPSFITIAGKGHLYRCDVVDCESSSSSSAESVEASNGSVISSVGSSASPACGAPNPHACDEGQSQVCCGDGYYICWNPEEECMPTCPPVPPSSSSSIPYGAICWQGKCEIHPGVVGGDQCDTNSDCRDDSSQSSISTVPPTYAKCDGTQCVVVEGVGADECDPLLGCGIDTHAGCTAENECKMMDGDGPNFCSGDIPCEQHTECQNGACVLVPGFGNNACETDANCLSVQASSTTFDDPDGSTSSVIVDEESSSTQSEVSESASSIIVASSDASDSSVDSDTSSSETVSSESSDISSVDSSDAESSESSLSVESSAVSSTESSDSSMETSRSSSTSFSIFLSSETSSVVSSFVFSSVSSSDVSTTSSSTSTVQSSHTSAVSSTSGRSQIIDSIGSFSSTISVVHVSSSSSSYTDECRDNRDCPNRYYCVSGECVPEIPPSRKCGNSRLDRDEQCDDGNVIPGDGCSAECQSEDLVPKVGVCGDGIAEYPEECDDGNEVNGDGCTATCLTEEGFCGDGIVQAILGEQCEVALHSPALPYSCWNCQFASPKCGNGRIDIGEECDDGNYQMGDGCSQLCRSEIFAAIIAKYRTQLIDPPSSQELTAPPVVPLNERQVLGAYSYPLRRGTIAPQTLVAGLHDTIIRTQSYPTQPKEIEKVVEVYAKLNAAIRLTEKVLIESSSEIQMPSAPPPAQLPLAQLQPLIQSRGPVGDTGPAAIAITGAGIAAGVGWMRRRKKL